MPKKPKKAAKKDWKSVIDDLPDQVADTAKTDAKDFVNQLLNDSDEFAQRQGKKIAGYLEHTPRGSSPRKS